jgi:dynein heavy chain
MLQVEAGMVESMQDVCRQGLEAYAATPRTSWVLQWPSQVVLAISAIYWTQEVSEAMQGAPAAAAAGGSGGSASEGQGSKGALGVVAAKCTSQLNEVVELVRGELSVLDRYEATSAVE